MEKWSRRSRGRGSNKATPDRKERRNLSQYHQSGSSSGVKAEVKEEVEETYVWGDEQCIEEEIAPEISTDNRSTQKNPMAEEEGHIRIKEEEVPVEIDINPGKTRGTQRKTSVDMEGEMHMMIKEEEVPIEISRGDFSNRRAQDGNWATQDYQNDGLVKVEVKEEGQDTYMRSIGQCKEEEYPTEIGADGQYRRIDDGLGSQNIDPLLGRSTDFLYDEENIEDMYSYTMDSDRGSLEDSSDEEEESEPSSPEREPDEQAPSSPITTAKVDKKGFSVTRFICKVREHACLYDPRNAYYKSRRKRNLAWNLIGSQIWTNWKTLSPATKHSMVHMMKLKWKNLKDAFGKHRRRVREQQQRSGQAMRVEYIHAQLMDFLTPCLDIIENQSSKDPIADNPIEVEDNGATQQHETEACVSTSVAMQTCAPPTLKKKTTKPPPTRPSQEPSGRPFRRRILRAQRGRAEREEYSLVELLQGMINPATNLSSEAHFLLSLEEKMKMVPIERQTELRTRLMEVVDSYLSLRGTKTTPFPTFHAKGRTSRRFNQRSTNGLPVRYPL